MTSQETFREFIRKVRAGDEQAAADLVRQYEPLIRREVRLRLDDRRLGRILDSMDVCQSVMASFFVRTAAGQFDLEQPQQLVRLLVAMARNKLASAARWQQRQRRDRRRTTSSSEFKLGQVASLTPEPSDLVAGKELLQRFRASLRSEERHIADLRGQGLSWAEIAARLGGTSQARRMQLSRAANRVARELGLDGASDE